MDTGNSERTPAASHPGHKALMTPKRTLIATAIAFPAALILYSVHLAGALPLGNLGLGLWCFWLLALGCVGFTITFLRVSKTMLAEDWRVGVAFGDLNHPPVSESTYDALLADDRPPNPYLRGSLWPVFGWIGGLCWGIAAPLTAAAALGVIHSSPTNIFVPLAVLLMLAGLCTGAAVNGPTLTAQYQMRTAAALAHLHRKTMQQRVGAAHDFNDAMADTAEITLPRPDLHVVDSGANGHTHSRHGANGT